MTTVYQDPKYPHQSGPMRVSSHKHDLDKFVSLDLGTYQDTRLLMLASLEHKWMYDGRTNTLKLL